MALETELERKSQEWIKTILILDRNEPNPLVMVQIRSFFQGLQSNIVDNPRADHSEIRRFEVKPGTFTITKLSETRLSWYHLKFDLH